MLVAATTMALGVAATIGCRWFVLRREKKMWKQRRDDKNSEHKNSEHCAKLARYQTDKIEDKLAQLSESVSTLKRALFYMAIFLYPVLNLRIFQAFVCMDVSGVRYLRCDFRCDHLVGQAYLHADDTRLSVCVLL